MHAGEGKSKRAFIVRDLKRSDANDLIRNYYLVYDEAKRRNPLVGIGLFPKRPSMDDERKWFRGLLKKVKNGTSVASVAEVDGRAVGLCEIGASSGIAEKKHLGVLGILVREGYRSGGIGTVLMGETLRKARGRYRMVRLEVFGTNKRAEQLYRRFGFRRYGVLPGGLVRKRKRIDEVMMYRGL